jgi:hypothetical protein
VWGAHVAALYARSAALASLGSLAHHFLSASKPGAASGYKLQGPTGPCYELCFSATAVVAYLKSLTPAGTLAAADTAIHAQEATLVRPLLVFLTAPEQRTRGVYVVGDERPTPGRCPTVAFVVRGARAMRSRDVVAHFDKAGGVGIRYGHFYAYTLVQELPEMSDVEDGVVRYVPSMPV